MDRIVTHSIPASRDADRRVNSPMKTAKGGTPMIANVPAAIMNPVKGMLLPTPLIMSMLRVP